VVPDTLDVGLRLSMLYGTVKHVAECPDLGPACGTDDPPTAFNHHVDLLMTNIDVDLAYGLTDWLAIEARLRLGISDVTARFSELDGTSRDDGKRVHHRTEVLAGPRDPWMMARIAASLGGFVSNARIGLSLPAGRTEANPYQLGRLGEDHQHIQFGSGTVRPIIAVSLRKNWQPVIVSLSGLGMFSFYANQHGYRAPTRLGGNLSVMLSLLDGKVMPRAKLVVAHQGPDIWDGEIGSETSVARSVILAGFGASYRFSEVWRFEADLLARVTELSDSPSFDAPGQLSLGLARSFTF
jgi:hypothetical protein